MAVTIKEVNHRETKTISELTVGDVFQWYGTLFVVTDYEDDEVIFEAMILTPESAFGVFGQLRAFFKNSDEDRIVEIVKDVEINVKY